MPPTEVKLPQVPGSGRRAREQAAEVPDSVFAPTPLILDDGEVLMIPPHPNLNMLDDDAQEEYEEYLYEVNHTYDRHPDIYFPQQTLDNGRVLPEETKRGELIGPPYEKGGQLVKPPHQQKVVRIALGEDGYAKLKAGGKQAADVWRIWNEQGLRVADRQNFRPQTNGRPGAVGPVPK
jgi:hypothetical protein